MPYTFSLKYKQGKYHSGEAQENPDNTYEKRSRLMINQFRLQR